MPLPIRPQSVDETTSADAGGASPSAPAEPAGRRDQPDTLWLSAQTWAYIALPICALSFAGNHIVGRAVAGHVPPVALATGRWLFACLILVPLGWSHLKRDWPQIRENWRILLFLTALAGGLFSTLQYVGLVYTTALNTALFNSTVPVFIALSCFLLFGDRLSIRQATGIAVSLAGVVAIIAKGQLQILKSWSFSSGDIIILANMALWSIYSAFLRYKPPLHWLSFGAVMAVVALICNLPFLAVEHMSGQVLQPTWITLGAILYAGFFASIAAFGTWNYGVAVIGPARAGVFLHLIPLFGSILAITLLGEPYGWYHGAGLALILGGVWLASR